MLEIYKYRTSTIGPRKKCWEDNTELLENRIIYYLYFKEHCPFLINWLQEAHMRRMKLTTFSSNFISNAEEDPISQAYIPKQKLKC